MPKPSKQDPARSALYKRALYRKLAEIREFIPVADFESRHLDPAGYRAISDEYDRILERLSGVSPRDRALVWLRDSVEGMAAQVDWDAVAQPKWLPLPQPAFLRFLDASITEVPPVGREGETLRLRALGKYFVACIARRRPGRPRKGTRPISVKWDAFRDLAHAFGLVSQAMPPEDLRRTVYRAKQRTKQRATSSRNV